MSGNFFTLADIAARVGGDVFGDGAILIQQVAPLVSAGQTEISFLSNPKYQKHLYETQASAVIISSAMAERLDLQSLNFALLVVKDPYATYAKVASLLNPSKIYVASAHPSAILNSDVPSSTSIAAGVVIGHDVELGEHVTILANTVIGDGVKVGAQTVIHPNVTLYDGCVIGDRVVIHAGTVIGADGFGFAPSRDGWLKIPQIGAVCIGDDVEIGANTTIDRGALSDTIIGRGCKLDNQIQIGHNCEIGEHTVIAGCVGIAGSTRIGRRCAIGGAAMILGHLQIADGCEISPGTMVMKSITQPGKYTALMPLASHDHWLRNAGQIRHLDTLAKRVTELEKQLEKQLQAKE